MKLQTFNHARFCDSTCSFCAREFFAWWKSRNAQMSMSLDDGTSFADAAATSVGAAGPTEHLVMATPVATARHDVTVRECECH
jgi:hypothetical protein